MQKRYGHRWQPGPQGGFYIAVDPRKERAEAPGSRRDTVHRTKWLCLDCLKTLQDFHADRVTMRTRICPSCRGPAVRAGATFTPPPLRAHRAWRAAINRLARGRLSSEEADRARRALVRLRALKAKRS